MLQITSVEVVVKEHIGDGPPLQGRLVLPLDEPIPYDEVIDFLYEGAKARGGDELEEEPPRDEPEEREERRPSKQAPDLSASMRGRAPTAPQRPAEEQPRTRQSRTPGR